MTGTADSTPLLSGFTVGDFELRFEWSATPGGACAALSLPDVPRRRPAITLKDGDGSGAIRDGERTLAPGKSVEARPRRRCTRLQIRRFGQTLTVIVDGRAGERSGSGPEPDDLAWRWRCPRAKPRSASCACKSRGNPLNNGRDLTGWFVNNNKGTMGRRQRRLHSHLHTGLHYLRTDKEYANFTLSLEYTISPGGNSGLAIRTAKDGWPSGDGMELQILDRPGAVKDSTMAIYGNVPPLDRADRSDSLEPRGGQGRRAHDLRLGQRRAGAACQHGRLPRAEASAPEGLDRPARPWRQGPLPQGLPARAPDGLGLDEWYQPRPEPGAGLVLDRVMNSEQLSRVDGLGSGLTTASVPKGGEHVLAELTGPGRS